MFFFSSSLAVTVRFSTPITLLIPLAKANSSCSFIGVSVALFTHASNPPDTTATVTSTMIILVSDDSNFFISLLPPRNVLV